VPLQRQRSLSQQAPAERPRFLPSLKLGPRETFEQGGFILSEDGAPLAVVDENSSASEASESAATRSNRPKGLAHLGDSNASTASSTDGDIQTVPVGESSDEIENDGGADGDPFGAERATLLRGRGPSLTRGDGFNPVDLNASYVISSHGTLVAGGFAISAQGLHAPSVANDGALSSRRSSVHRANSAKRANSLGRTPSTGSGTNAVVGKGTLEGVPTSSIAVSYPDDDDDVSSSPIPSDDESVSPSREREPRDRDHHALKAEDLFTLGVIGKGQNGSVLKAIHLPTLTRVALKSIYAHDRSTRHQLLHELTAYLHFDSPFLVSFLGAYYAHDLIVLATEYMDKGSLSAFIAEQGPLKQRPRVFRQVAFQCVAGLKHMHDRHALHRDIKPENILLEHSSSVKLADFGLLRDLGDTAAMSHTFLGTMSYLSPERITSSAYSYPADIWALGLTFRFALTGQVPKQHPDYFHMLDIITKSPPEPLTPDMHASFTEPLCDFVNGMLRLDPAARYTCDDLLAHPFLLGPDAPLDDDDALFAAFERQIPQTGLVASDADAVVWAVGEDNMADLDLILERLVRQHLVPELEAAMRRAPQQQQTPALTTPNAEAMPFTPVTTGSSPTTAIASPATSSYGGNISGLESSPDVPLVSEASPVAWRPALVPIASASDESFTTSMHHAHALQGLTPSSDASGGVIETVPVTVPTESSSLSPVESDSGNRLRVPIVLPTAELSSSNEGDESDELSASPSPMPLQRLTLGLPGGSSFSSDVAVASPADSASSSLSNVGSDVAASSSSPVATAEDDETASSPPSGGSGFGLSLRITARESLEQTGSPLIDEPIPIIAVEDADTIGGSGAISFPIPVLDASDAAMYEEEDTPGSGSVHALSLRPRLGLSLGSQSNGAEESESMIQTFSVDETAGSSSGSGSGGSSGAAEDAFFLSNSASPLSAVSTSSPMEVAGLELLHLDSERCECLARQFALTPDDVQARFLDKQRQLLTARRIVLASTPH